MTHDAVEKDKTSVTQFFKAFLSQKILLSSQKYGLGIRDPGTGQKLRFRIQIQWSKGTGSQIWLHNTCRQGIFLPIGQTYRT
jgi:hypothetical protein